MGKIVELKREDWEQGRDVAAAQLKNAMCQVIVFRGQMETCEKELLKFPEKKKKEESPKMTG